MKTINNTSINQTLAPIALCCTAFAWGSSFVALKHAMEVFSPYSVIFMRMLIASICFLLLKRFFGKIEYQKGDWIYLVLMSLGEPCFYFVFEAYAVKYTSAGSVGVINSLMPPMVAIAAWFFLKEKINRWAVIGLSIAIVGAVALTWVSTSSEHAPNPVLGNLLEFGAMASSCFYVIILAKISSRYSAFFLTAMQSFVGSLFFLPFAWYQPVLVAGQNPDWTHILSVIYLGIFVSLGGYFAYNWGVSKIGASKAAMFVNLVPVFSLLIGFLLLGERLSIVQLACVGLILAGVILSQKQTVAS